MAQPAASKGARQRPLSPHLQIWRWSITMASSIAHRASGIALGAGTLLLAWWLIAAASGPEAYAGFEWVMDGLIGRLALYGFALALIFHLMNGIRHLFWDIGIGFSPKVAERSGAFVFAGAFILTNAVFVLGYWLKGDLG